MQLGRSQGRYLVAMTVLCAGIIASLVSFVTVRQYEAAKVRVLFERAAHDQSELFGQEILNNIEILYAIRSFYAASENVELNEFIVFAQNILQRQRDIDSVSWIPYVSYAYRSTFEAAMRSQGITNFTITELTADKRMVAAGDREMYFPIVYTKSLQESHSVVGFDVGSEPMRLHALKRACDEGVPIATGGIEIVESPGEYGCRIFMPLYHHEVPHMAAYHDEASRLTAGDRCSALSGFISLTFKIRETLQLSLQSLKPVGLDKCIYDITDGPTGQRLCFFPARLRTAPITFAQWEHTRHPFQWSTVFNIAGRRWQMIYTPCPEFMKRYQTSSALLTLISGLLLTAVIVIYLIYVLGHAERVEALIKERTLALNESNKQLVKIAEEWCATFDSIHDLISVQSADYRLIRVNRAYADAFGMQPDGVVGKRCYEIVHGTSCPFEGCPHEEVLRTKKSVTRELFEPRLKAYLEVSVSPIIDETGAVVGSVHIAKDITERKRTDEKIRMLVQEQQTILDSTHTAIFYKDTENRYMRVNRAFAEMVGIAKEALEGKTSFECFPKEQASTFWSDEKEIFASGKPKLNITIWTDTALGKRLIQTDKFPYHDAQGKIIGVVGFAVDITERRKIEENLQLSEERFRTLVANVPGAIYRCINDRQWTMDFISAAIRDISGYPASDFIHNSVRTYASIIHADDRARVFDTIQDALSRREPYSLEYRIVRIDGTIRWVHEKGQGVFAEGVEPRWLDGVIFDITDRKHLEHLKDEFVSTVSHELRTPLTIIREGVALVLDQIPGAINEKQNRILVTARENIDRLANIINSLLDISRIEAGKVELHRERTDIAALVRKVALLFETGMRNKGLELHLVLPHRAVEIAIDAERITQVLFNLVGNAIKFTDKGYIEIGLKEADENVVVWVHDTGRGIAPQDIPLAFTKFQQFGRSIGAGQQGTGLGLAIAKGIVEAHHGTIHLESVLGKGSTFTFILPRG